MSEAEQNTDNQEVTDQGIVPEEGQGAFDASEESAEQETQEPLEPLAAAQQEALTWKDVALRTKAELENYRKRMARERADTARYANADLLQSLLPILDNFEFGLMAAKAEEGSSIYLGMSMVLKQIEDFLSEQGVETIPAVGQPFDPNVHDAVAQESSDEVPDGHVVAQVRRGYKLHERLLRPAGVRVSTGPALEESPAADEPTA
ncbi:MAG: nucleotide exchange factor GrpE [Verrucomicrobiae bacterium]|nr:nucleotide exchange factor GrpE [Verrucomicrobiae bacterium]